mmetsp:Transcript_94911/g.238049  ORF Transcript_94911/g.238049 Transcript_94911/m.238049 type:complete len:235 (-) Transcript_94911:12-716(-)
MHHDIHDNAPQRLLPLRQRLRAPRDRGYANDHRGDGRGLPTQVPRGHRLHALLVLGRGEELLHTRLLRPGDGGCCGICFRAAGVHAAVHHYYGDQHHADEHDLDQYDSDQHHCDQHNCDQHQKADDLDIVHALAHKHHELNHINLHQTARRVHLNAVYPQQIDHFGVYVPANLVLDICKASPSADGGTVDADGDPDRVDADGDPDLDDHDLDYAGGPAARIPRVPKEVLGARLG